MSPDGEHATADCPACLRTDVPGDVDHKTGNIILRRHKTKKTTGRGGGVPYCSGGRRVDAGPASPLLAYALDAARRGTPRTTTPEGDPT